MGFWHSLKAIAKDFEERHAASTQMAYSHGKLAGWNGSDSEYFVFQDAGRSPEWLAAYGRSGPALAANETRAAGGSWTER